MTSSWFCRKTSWRFALLLSLAIHALAGLLLSLIPGAAPRPAEAAYPAIDVCEIDHSIRSETSIFLPGGSINQQPETDPANTRLYQPTRAEMKPFKPILLPVSVKGPQTGKLKSPETPGSSDGQKNTNGGGNHDDSAAGNGAGKGGGNGAATTSFFGVPAEGRKVVFVFDRSSSMGTQGALNIARRELLGSLFALPADTFFQIIVYNSVAHPIIPNQRDWLASTWENKRLVAGELAKLYPTNGTVHKLALPMALSLQPDVIYFLTDADDLELYYLNTITKRNQGSAAIHVIELNTSNMKRIDSPLQQFARQNQGTYRAVDLNWYAQE